MNFPSSLTLVKFTLGTSFRKQNSQKSNLLNTTMFSRIGSRMLKT